MKTKFPSRYLSGAPITLLRAPGNYTAIIKGKNNTTGPALVEVYQFDN